MSAGTASSSEASTQAEAFGVSWARMIRGEGAGSAAESEIVVRNKVPIMKKRIMGGMAVRKLLLKGPGRVGPGCGAGTGCEVAGGVEGIGAHVITDNLK